MGVKKVEEASRTSARDAELKAVEEKNAEIARLQKQLEELPNFQAYESIMEQIRAEEAEKRTQLEEQIRKEEEDKRRQMEEDSMRKLEEASRKNDGDAELRAMQEKDAEIAKLQKQLEDLPNYQAYEEIMQKIRVEEEEKRKKLEEQIRKEEEDKRVRMEQ